MALFTLSAAGPATLFVTTPPLPPSAPIVGLIPFTSSVPPFTVTDPVPSAAVFPNAMVPAVSVVPPVCVLALLIVTFPEPLFVIAAPPEMPFAPLSV